MNIDPNLIIPDKLLMAKVHFGGINFEAEVDHYYLKEPLTNNGPVCIVIDRTNLSGEIQKKLPNLLRVPKEAEFINV